MTINIYYDIISDISLNCIPCDSQEVTDSQNV